LVADGVKNANEARLTLQTLSKCECLIEPETAQRILCPHMQHQISSVRVQDS
jgi:hypothetical protein